MSAPQEFIVVPETTLPCGIIVPSFQVGKYLASRGPADIVQINADNLPWVHINFYDAIKACESSGFKLLTETQALAIVYDIEQQDIHWTGGEVGKGIVYQGLRWYQLSNGERIYDLAGNAYWWVFDDVQGNAQGLSGQIAPGSPSITTPPFPSIKKSSGVLDPWDWSGLALVRGGYAGFDLRWHGPRSENEHIGFRCTMATNVKRMV